MKVFPQFKNFSGYLLLSILILTLTGCTVLDFFEGNSNPLVGIWGFKDKSMGPLTVRYFRDKTYHVDFQGDGEADIIGHYTLFDYRLTFHDDTGQIGAECHENGYYYISRKGKNLEFKYIVDQCPYRAQALAVKWEKIK